MKKESRPTFESISMSPDVSSSPPAPASSRSRTLWKWYFLIVIGLTLAATLSLLWFNWHIQLTPEELARQGQVWEQQRPADYNLAYLEVQNDAEVGKCYKVNVRAGKVVLVQEYDVRVRERQEVEPVGQGTPLPPEKAAEHSMERLFEKADALLAEDAATGRRAYARARFHSENGAILDFVHRLMGTRQRVQISVLAFRFGADLKE